MSFTLLQRSSSTQGDAAATAGTWHTRPRGPTLASDTLGHSADTRGQVNLYDKINMFPGGSPSTPYQTMAVSQFLFVNDWVTDGVNSSTPFEIRVDTDGAMWFAVIIDHDLQFAWANYSTGKTRLADNLGAYKGKWIELRLASGLNAGNYYFGIYLRVCGTSSWATLYEGQAPGNQWQGWQFLRVGNQSGGGEGHVASARTFYVFAQMAAWADRELLMGTAANWTDAADALADPATDPADPNSPPYTWYVDTINGNDSATQNGATSGTAWASGTKVTQEAQYAGIFRAPVGSAWLNGTSNADLAVDADALYALVAAGTIVPNADKVIVVSHGGTEQRIAGLLSLPFPAQGVISDIADTSGVWNGTNRANLTHFTVLAAGGWSKTGGYTNIYECADTASANTFLWEDRKPMNHSAGANFAAVADALDATANMYYADGSKRYVHASDGSDPATSGKVYERSQVNSSGGAGISAGYIRGVRFTATTLCDQTLNIPVGGWAMALPHAGSDLGVIWDCDVAYTDKHGMGASFAGGMNRGIRINTSYAGLNPFISSGSASLDVDYCGDTSTGNQFYYQNARAMNNAQSFGSATFVYSQSLASEMSHGGAADNFQKGFFVSCNFTSGGYATLSAAAPLTVTGCTLGGWVSLGTSCTGSTYTGTSFTAQNAADCPNLTGTFTNCTLTITGACNTSNPNNRLTANIATISGCTIIATAATGTAVWYKNSAAANNLTLTGNTIIIPQAMQLLGEDGQTLSSAELTLANNTWQGYLTVVRSGADLVVRWGPFLACVDHSDLFRDGVLLDADAASPKTDSGAAGRTHIYRIDAEDAGDAVMADVTTAAAGGTNRKPMSVVMLIALGPIESFV